MKKGVWIWIFVIGTALLLTGIFDPSKYPFPKCPFLLITGFQCPGCGSQRAIHQLMHGNILQSIQLNLLLLPALLYVITGLLIPFLPKEKYLHLRKVWFGRNAAIIILAITSVFWIGRNLV